MMKKISTFSKVVFFIFTSTILSSSLANGAIVAGIDKGNGVWNLAGTDYDFRFTSLTHPSSGQIVDTAWFGRGAGRSLSAELYRRDTNVSVTTSIPNGAMTYRSSSSGLINNAIMGSDNWILLSLEAGESDYDTAIQYSFDDISGVTGDSIVQIWHDDAPSGENVIAGVTSFSEIVATSVPEPSSASLILLSSLTLILRRNK